MLTAEQLEQRTKGIGGSDAAAVVGLCPFKSPIQLYLEKRGELPPDEEETLAMKFGTLLEEPLAQHYADVTGRKIRRHPTRFSSKHPHMLVNVDRIILNDPRGPGYLECKTMNEWIGRGIQGVDDIPDHFFIQGQHGLCVTEWAFVSYAILIGNSRFIWFDVDRHDDVIAELVRQEAEFWERVQTGNPPPIDGSSRTADLLKQLYPSDNGTVLTIPAPELIEAAQHLAINKALVKQLDADITLFENQLKSAIGDASELILPGFGSITWKRAKESVKTKLDVEKLQADYPDIYAACVTTATVPGSRRFLLKPQKEVA